MLALFLACLDAHAFSIFTLLSSSFRILANHSSVQTITLSYRFRPLCRSSLTPPFLQPAGMVTFGTTTVGPMQLGVFVFMGILTLAGVCASYEENGYRDRECCSWYQIISAFVCVFVCVRVCFYFAHTYHTFALTIKWPRDFYSPAIPASNMLHCQYTHKYTHTHTHTHKHNHT
jgi:hypothetical protein